MPSYLVTGANRGIGLEFVRQLSAVPDGVVFALVRNKNAAEKLLELQSKSGNVHILEGDITDLASLKAAAEDVKKVTGGTLNMLINNAAKVGDPRSPWTVGDYTDGREELLEEDIAAYVRVNATAVAQTINVFLPLLKAGSATTTSRVVAISSGLAETDGNVRGAIPWTVPYCVSKAALNMIIAKFAASFHDENFVFLSVSPGFVNSAEKPPAPEALPFITELMKGFKRAFPDWGMQPATPQQSITEMLDVINRWEKKHSGAWVSQKGNKEWL